MYMGPESDVFVHFELNVCENPFDVRIKYLSVQGCCLFNKNSLLTNPRQDQVVILAANNPSICVSHKYVLGC